eukprot:4710404-Prymnesium_polylepis.1
MIATGAPHGADHHARLTCVGTWTAPSRADKPAPHRLRVRFATCSPAIRLAWRSSRAGAAARRA